MEDLPLPGLLPTDPRTCLSEAARKRIWNAHAEAELIQTRALAAIEARYRSEADREMSFFEYHTTGQAGIEFTEAKLNAARAVLPTVKDEFQAAGKTGWELHRIIQDELEAASNSLELTMVQRNLLWQELGLYRYEPQTTVKRDADPTTAKPENSATGGGAQPQFPNRAAWLKERLRERAWNTHDVQRHRGPDRKTVQKILDGKATREDVLEKLATALSDAPKSKVLPAVKLTDIPQD